ncbi:MBL fold metallo-hydrolase [Miniphocaeibacter halophilus]|uniref:MBL fold metallo-hydrolase n=1 Tax=Miniphocaeibacter halophilus TaxID=2931922 RepID=A0AC61MZR9_9FIRM|nr:MBL fold metallo-hydrolase [Miniphocaeibacter halophilus]QQK08656.1 MBL fold metallo-hydrolase [Miniphocaeibacter halophilus]
MKLRVLVDNNTYINHYYLGEPGASYYMEIDNEKILLDTGYSGIVVENAKKMDVDLSQLNKIIISHGHDDHTKGLMKIIEKFNTSNMELISHPDAFYPKRARDEDVGSPLSRSDISKEFKYNPSKEPLNVTENCIFLGEIPEYFDFEKRRVLGEREVDEKLEDDYMIDDSALVCKLKDGIFIVTGCSHSGICNIVEHAKKICNDDRILGIIGGFHLFKTDERLKKTIDYFLDNKVKMVYPCHCTSLGVKAEILKKFDFNEVGVGFKLEIE